MQQTDQLAEVRTLLDRAQSAPKSVATLAEVSMAQVTRWLAELERTEPQP